MDCEEIQEISEKASKIVIDSRIKRRDELKHNQVLHRISTFSKNRFLESEILKESDIKGLCGRIKRRKHCTEEDLEKLTNAFFQSEENIVEFLNITGAINVLIKELIGNNNRLLAAQCLCNLSLGNEIACNKVASFAGCYIMILLKNLSHTMLIKILVWTIENLITSGSKALETLLAQELLMGILYVIDTVSDVQIKREAIQTLEIIVDKKCTQMSDDELQEVIKCISNYIKRNECDLHALQIFYRILSIEKLHVVVTPSMLEIIINNSLKIDADESLVILSVEILLILCRKDIQYSDKFLEFLMQHELKLSIIINESCSTPKLYALSRKYLKLVGTVLSRESVKVANYLNFDDILSNLKISKMFAFN